MNFEKILQDVQDTLTVMAEMERRQSSMLREHSERIVSLEEKTAEDRRESAKFRKLIDQNLAEITDKLNGLIGYVAGQDKPGGKPPQ